MSNRSNALRNPNRKTTKLGIEQLEARLMNSIDNLESGLQLLHAPGLLGSTQIVSNTNTQTHSPPTVASPLRLTNATTVLGKTASLSVLGADNGGESQLKYSWTMVNAPTGGTIQFNHNRTNAAKNNVLTFNKPGSYQVLVTISDAHGLSTSSSLDLNVEQKLTKLAIKTATSTNEIRRVFTVQGLDQFGGAMIEKPTFTWQTLSTPARGNATLTPDGDTVAAVFHRAGIYRIQAQASGVSSTVSVQVTQSLTSLDIASPSGISIDPSQPISIANKSTQFVVRGFDQFGNVVSTLPSVVWSTVSAPPGGVAIPSDGSGTPTIAFSKAGVYTLKARVGTISKIVSFDVTRTLTSIVAYTQDNRPLGSNMSVSASGRNVGLTVRGFDQFGYSMPNNPNFEWTILATPPNASTTIQQTGAQAVIAFQRAGSYTIGVTAGKGKLAVKINVLQTLTSVAVSPGTLSLNTNASQQFRYQAVDQFGQNITNQPAALWATTGGKISSNGLFNTGARAGSFTVTARVGTILGTASVVVTSSTPTPTPNPTPTPTPTPSGALRNAAIANLVSSLYVDNQLTRPEVIQVLRSVGGDGIVDAIELADLQFLTSSSSIYAMPAYVRELAKDVVNSNPANRMFKGQVAGNLAAGSSATLLYNLVDKWFLGADEPALTNSSYSYQTAVGNLFNGTPSRSDARQGQLGDCYFIAALVSIADSNPEAVRNLFIDNSDGTYTVRFYVDGKADYVTVNRRLPSSSGQLRYSGYGQSITSTSTTLWIALAEKAYAQWNETGNEGRDGTNRYAAIEGGWMSYVNAQVLSTSSSNYSFAATSKQTLISALTAGRAVTLGTKPTSGDGLYGSHAYSVTGYNPATDTFTLHNPWGYSHAAPLSWAQLQANCSSFTVADPTGSVANSLASVRSLMNESFIGNWTTVVLVRVESAAEKLSFDQSTMQSEPVTISPANSIILESNSPELDVQGFSEQADEKEDSSNERLTIPLTASLVDLAMSVL